MVYAMVDEKRGISGNFRSNSWDSNLINQKPSSKVTDLKKLKEDPNFKFMIMKESAKIPKDISKIAEELGNHYGISITILAKELKRQYRRQKIRKEKEKLKEQAEYMGKLYSEDKELTEITRALECEDFHDY